MGSNAGTGAQDLVQVLVKDIDVIAGLEAHSVHFWYAPKKNNVIGKREDIIVAANKYVRKTGPQNYRDFFHRAESEEQYRNLNCSVPATRFTRLKNHRTPLIATFTMRTWDRVTG